MIMDTHDLHFYEISIIHNILINIWNHSHQLFLLLWSYLFIYPETLLNVYYSIWFIYFYYVYINQGHTNSIKLRLFIIFQYIFKPNQQLFTPTTVYFPFLSIHLLWHIIFSIFYQFIFNVFNTQEYCISFHKISFYFISIHSRQHILMDLHLLLFE